MRRIVFKALVWKQQVFLQVRMVLKASVQKQNTKQSLHKVSSEAEARRCSSVTGKHLCWSLFLIKLQVWRSATYEKETPTQVFPREYCKVFENSFSYWNLLWLLLSVCIVVLWFDKVNGSVIGVCRPSLINLKPIVGWFILKRFAVLGMSIFFIYT